MKIDYKYALNKAVKNLHFVSIVENRKKKIKCILKYIETCSKNQYLE